MGHYCSIKLLSITLLLSGILYPETIKLTSCQSDLINPGCQDIEREALLRLKQGLDDPSDRLSSWVGEDCCRWRGVSCSNRTGHVVKLKLRNTYPDTVDGNGTVHELGGEINPSLLHLKYLNYIDLSMNNFGGVQIPSFIGSLERLRYLNLSGSFTNGKITPNLGNLSSLRYLDLRNVYEQNENDLQWISGLSSLKHLNLGGLDLSKAAAYWLHIVNMLPSLAELHLSNCALTNLPLTLPFVNLTSLLVLDLSNNGFNSSIPHWLFNVSSLQRLDLNSNNFQGELPDAFTKLDSLQQLDLSQNGIRGQLSTNFGKLCNLQTLKLSLNNISGEITNFIDGLSGCTNSSLESLNLGYNKLSGKLPASLGYLKNLRYLLLWHNSFRGSIPPSIGNLSSLEEFYLSSNEMTGTFPESLGQLSALTALDLSENPWEGVITEAHFVNLSSLKDFQLTKLSPNISLVFNISSDWIPPFKLEFINTRSCQLGPKFPTWLRNQNELVTLVLNNARISDTIPDWFWQLDLQLNELDVAYNQLSGRVPNSLGFHDPTSTVDLSSNRFEGPLPLWSSNVTALYLRDNLFSGPIPRDMSEVMPFLTDLDISMNSLNGSIPLSIGNLNWLTTLVISNNNLSGEIPQFWSNIPFLYILDLSNNSLSGTIPRSIGSLSFLRFLILSKNNLSGELPPSSHDCNLMDSLDLADNKFTGNLPAWIAKSMPSLLILSLRSNFFSGNIPSEICSLSALHILDLSHNNLSGFIPPCIGNLTGMKSEFTDKDAVQYEGRLRLVEKGRVLQYEVNILYLVNSLDLSSNNLSGEIPIGFTSLIKLRTLNLSMNHLTGSVPVLIGNLESLETLDFSRNKLSGPIPPSMASLTFLNHLNLSYNNLSGKIPTANQFQTLNEPSIYEGNLALCGLPLPTECHDNDETPESPGDDRDNNDGEDGDGFERLWFFISVGLGFFVGFWGVCGTLIIKKSWRYAYFRFVDETKDKLRAIVSVNVSRLQRKVLERTSNH